MKKILAILLAIILVMSMAACNKAPSAQDDITAAAGNSTTDTTGDNNAAEDSTTGSNNATEGTEITDPTGSTTDATQGATDSTGSTTDATQGTESTLPSGTTTTPPTGATDVTEPTHTHEYTNKVTAATCTTDGYTTHTCACGNTYTDSTTKATGHSFGEWKTTKEATTTTTGTAERKCSQCSEKETKTLGKLVNNHKHNYTSKITKTATCSADGVRTYTCSCGDTYTESVAKTSHNYKSSVTAPTCTNGGYTTHTCTSCGTSYSDTKTNATGHAYSATKNQTPTCTEQGYTLYTCSRCGASYKDNVKPAAGHDYDVTSNTATCTTTGTKTETCYFCGDKKTSSSPAKGHGTTRTETKEATTTAAGYTRVICNDCNGVISETVIPKKESSHTCSYQRINCADLKDNAIPFYTTAYRTYTQCSILACTECGKADVASLEYALTTQQATAMIIEMINELRYEVYGTHEYDVVASTHTSCAEWAAEYISTNWEHCTPFYENLYHGGLTGNVVRQAFNGWKNSPGHYSFLINKDLKYYSLGMYANNETGCYAALVMWDKDEMYLDNPNYTWSPFR